MLCIIETLFKIVQWQKSVEVVHLMGKSDSACVALHSVWPLANSIQLPCVTVRRRNTDSTYGSLFEINI